MTTGHYVPPYSPYKCLGHAAEVAVDIATLRLRWRNAEDWPIQAEADAQSAAHKLISQHSMSHSTANVQTLCAEVSGAIEACRHIGLVGTVEQDTAEHLSNGAALLLNHQGAVTCGGALWLLGRCRALVSKQPNAIANSAECRRLVLTIMILNEAIHSIAGATVLPDALFSAAAAPECFVAGVAMNSNTCKVTTASGKTIWNKGSRTTDMVRYGQSICATAGAAVTPLQMVTTPADVAKCPIQVSGLTKKQRWMWPYIISAIVGQAVVIQGTVRDDVWDTVRINACSPTTAVAENVIIECPYETNLGDRWEAWADGQRQRLKDAVARRREHAAKMPSFTAACTQPAETAAPKQGPLDARGPHESGNNAHGTLALPWDKHRPWLNQ
jgi:hypothetical protein